MGLGGENQGRSEGAQLHGELHVAACLSNTANGRRASDNVVVAVRGEENVEDQGCGRGEHVSCPLFPQHQHPNTSSLPFLTSADPVLPWHHPPAQPRSCLACALPSSPKHRPPQTSTTRTHRSPPLVKRCLRIVPQRHLDKAEHVPCPACQLPPPSGRPPRHSAPTTRYPASRSRALQPGSERGREGAGFIIKGNG